MRIMQKWLLKSKLIELPVSSDAEGDGEIDDGDDDDGTDVGVVVGDVSFRRRRFVLDELAEVSVPLTTPASVLSYCCNIDPL